MHIRRIEFQHPPKPAFDRSEAWLPIALLILWMLALGAAMTFPVGLSPPEYLQAE